MLLISMPTTKPGFSTSSYVGTSRNTFVARRATGDIDVTNGMLVLVDGIPCEIVESTKGNTAKHVKTKMRHLRTGAIVFKTWSNGSRPQHLVMTAKVATYSYFDDVEDRIARRLKKCMLLPAFLER